MALTNVACRLFDDTTCRCAQYQIRHQFVPECIVLTPENLRSEPLLDAQTCAYRLLRQGKPLYDWHPLISGTPDTVHDAGRVDAPTHHPRVRGARRRLGRPHHRGADLMYFAI